MDVQSAAGLSNRYLWSEADIDAIFLTQHTQNPFGNQQLLYSFFRLHRLEFDFVLFVKMGSTGKIAHFGVSVFDFASRLCDEVHCLRAQVLPLGEGPRVVVSLLVDGRIVLIHFTNYIKFELTHRLESKPCSPLELGVGFPQDIFWCTLEGFPLLCIKRAKQIQGRYFGKRIDVGRPEFWNDIQVTGTGLNVGKQARTVYSFPGCQNGFKVVLAGDDEVEGLQFTIFTRIAEIDHLNVVLLDVPDDVVPVKF